MVEVRQRFQSSRLVPRREGKSHVIRIRTLQQTIAPLTILLTAPMIAHAHPGHGHHPSDSVLHYVAEPWHVGAMVVTLICTAAAASWLAHRGVSKRRVH